jgi:hypothetical protein
MKRLLFVMAGALIALVAVAPAPAPTPLPTPEPEASYTPSPQRILGLIRARFRSHRPPPPYETYTLIRTQKTDRGYPDYLGSYTYHIWVRNLDRAALARKIFRLGAIGDPEFQRPAFNEDRDPGPPTADVFQPAPKKPTTVFDVPTPEPTNGPALQVIGQTRVVGEYDYTVVDLKTEGNLLHLYLQPIRDPERNRLREIYADKNTYEVTRLIAHDRLFDYDHQIYNVIFDIRFSMLDGIPVVTFIHGDVGKTAGGVDYDGDGKQVDFTFKDITFPTTLPEWYFNPRSYGSHMKELPI